MWASEAWRASAVAWLDEQLSRVGMKRTGEVEQPHLRPWATVLRAPTTGLPVWLKATGPGTAFEVGLYELLNRVVGEHVLTPIAIDLERSWVLLPDGGPTLGDRVEGDGLIDAFATILPRYARLQRCLAPQAENILALGVSDMRPAMMPTRFDEALEAFGPPEQVAAQRENFASWCARLAAMPGPASIDHNDLHPYNMLVSGPGAAGEVRFYDWGDAVLAHPFACMLVPLGWIRDRLSVAEDGPEVRRVRDAYLEVFSDLAPHAELVEALELACRVGKVARALTWGRAVMASSPEEMDDEYASAPLYCLRSLLDQSYLGGA